MINWRLFLAVLLGLSFTACLTEKEVEDRRLGKAQLETSVYLAAFAFGEGAIEKGEGDFVDPTKLDLCFYRADLTDEQLQDTYQAKPDNYNSAWTVAGEEFRFIGRVASDRYTRKQLFQLTDPRTAIDMDLEKEASLIENDSSKDGCPTAQEVASNLDKMVQDESQLAGRESASGLVEKEQTSNFALNLGIVTNDFALGTSIFDGYNGTAVDFSFQEDPYYSNYYGSYGHGSGFYGFDDNYLAPFGTLGGYSPVYPYGNRFSPLLWSQVDSGYYHGWNYNSVDNSYLVNNINPWGHVAHHYPYGVYQAYQTAVVNEHIQFGQFSCTGYNGYVGSGAQQVFCPVHNIWRYPGSCTDSYAIGIGGNCANYPWVVAAPNQAVYGSLPNCDRINCGVTHYNRVYSY